MALVTIQVVEGLERGRVYTGIQTPFTIGREEDNAIQLNDERVSRFHTKIQEDGGRVILTDLDSTNGTRINGHPVQMRVLRVGDQLQLGRCLLVFGSRAELASHFARRSDESKAANLNEDEHLAFTTDPSNEHTELFVDGIPEPPQDLSPLQQAQYSDLLAYFHDRICTVLEAGLEERDGDESTGVMRVSSAGWKRLLDLEMDIAAYLRKAAEPRL